MLEQVTGERIGPAPRLRVKPRGTVAAALHSVAVELPAERLSSAELAGQLGISEEWILSRTGIRERPIAAAGERLADMSARAALVAMERAGIEPADLDMVLAATITADEVTPGMAPLVADAIGAHRAGGFDLNAACNGFLTGVAVAAGQIETGRSRHVLLIGADFVTRITNWEDRRTAPLFGDAAGAAVLGPAEDGPGSIGPVVLGMDGSNGNAIRITHDERRIHMDGPEVYKHAVARMSEATVEAVRQAGHTLADIDLFVYHQANARITRALGERLGLDADRVVDCIETLGNSSAATLPLGLDCARRDGRLRSGTRVLLGAFGGGFTWGAVVVEWGGAADG